jgi:hypothetical protein
VSFSLPVSKVVRENTQKEHRKTMKIVEPPGISNTAQLKIIRFMAHNKDNLRIKE